MDKFAIISDIHGNLHALEAVLEDIGNRGIRRIICLGDIVGKGPGSAEAVDIIKDVCEVVVKGNWDHDIAVIEDHVKVVWHQNELGRERLDYLVNLPIYTEFYMSGKLVRLCHASPHDINHRVYTSTDDDERIRLFQPTPTLDKAADVIGYGDIHGAHIDYFRYKTIFNTGSVGNPLEIPQASYAVIEGVLNNEDEGPFSISIIRVPYDIEGAVRHAEETEMPHKKEFIRELRTAVYRRLNK